MPLRFRQTSARVRLEPLFANAVAGLGPGGPPYNKMQSAG